jgi:signal transduction histidine kinase
LLKKNIQFQFKKGSEIPIEVFADKNKIYQVLVNVFSNAVKYGKIDGEITASVYHLVDKKILIEITDNGIGIDLKYQEEIFNKYYRIPNNRDVKGSCLGLSFVKELVLLLGGDIQLESERKKGSKFTVIIPIERLEKSIKHSNSYANKANQAEKQESILIVEDNYEIQKLLKRFYPLYLY